MDFVNGIDVSDYQGKIDWRAVRAAGYSFAIAKATQSTGNVQDSFRSNIVGIRAAGMVAGAYHFFDWFTDPKAQAEHFLSVYNPQPGDLPPTIDCEGAPPPPEVVTKKVSAFLHAVETHLWGARAMIYCSYAFVGCSLPDGPFTGHPLWVAAYNNDPIPPMPGSWPPRMWQWNDNQDVAGISGGVDADRFCGTLVELHDFTLKGPA